MVQINRLKQYEAELLDPSEDNRYIPTGAIVWYPVKVFFLPCMCPECVAERNKNVSSDQQNSEQVKPEQDDNGKEA